ncbi:MAG: glycogen synthase GlgA [Acidobacteria bacterium]|nr:glycogen synthase GlgA [Acidobacteriota bacterium]
MPPRPPRSLRVLMVASEAYPFSKTGGLADVTIALAKTLGRRGHTVTLMTPRYRGMAGEPVVDRTRIQMAGAWFDVALAEIALGPNARALFVDCPPLYDRAGYYNEHGIDYEDNAVRFGLLAATAVDWLGRQPDPPHVVHAHDWQTGLTPVYLRDRGGPPSVFTIHNLAYQGNMDKAWVPRLGLGWKDFTVGGFEFYDRLSFLKGGVAFADHVTTVSPTYAEEIQRPEYGYGFDGVMRSRRDHLTGILNGIDTDEWNPEADPYLPQPFDAQNLEGKAAAKRALLDTYQLPVDEAALARPVIGMVSRMVDQKGLDLIAAMADGLPALDAAFTVLGTGEARYQDMWRTLSARWPDRIGVYIGYDERRAHLIEAGADIFLMPSRYEPCGLNQMYSLRYGTVPIVRAVGGLVDTVRPFNRRNGQGTGFLFADYRPAALAEALEAALALYRRQPRSWARLQKNGMRKDFSWDRSAAEYVKVYKGVMSTRRSTPSGGGGH